MAKDFFKIEQTPTAEELNRALNQLQDNLRENRPTWNRIAKEVLVPSIKKAFSKREAQDGTRWEPLTRRYGEEKRRAGGNRAELLRGPGRDLFNSLTRISGGSDGQRLFTRSVMKFGTEFRKSVPLQEGWKPKGSNRRIDGRPFVTWNSEMRRAALEIMLEETDKKVDRVFDPITRGGS